MTSPEPLDVVPLLLPDAPPLPLPDELPPPLLLPDDPPMPPDELPLDPLDGPPLEEPPSLSFCCIWSVPWGEAMLPPHAEAAVAKTTGEQR
jgi:hypothetical protein